MRTVPRAVAICNLSVLVGVSASAVGCESSTKSELASKAAPVEAAAAIEAYDADSNGKLSTTELAKAPALLSGINRLDANRDFVVTLDELQSRLQTVENGSDLIALAVSVTAKGRPLRGASVTLTPAAFMGAGLQSYSGASTTGGSRQLHGSEISLPGLPVGYYEAKITHPQFKVNQIVGYEIADDASGSHLDLRF